MNIDKNTRLIDLTVADLMVIIKERMTGFMPVNKIFNDEDEIGGYEIAETITGYSRQTLYQLKSAGVALHRFTRGWHTVFKKDVNELVTVPSKAYKSGNKRKSGNTYT
ncbi:hypothetical protein [Mucilaginibacter sp.]|uniref:hypothetical protein n=1 Tax=Mucilaginibacter sp. TaxID=1882438 RepID=UPI0035BC31CD